MAREPSIDFAWFLTWCVLMATLWWWPAQSMFHQSLYVWFIHRAICRAIWKLLMQANKSDSVAIKNAWLGQLITMSQQWEQSPWISWVIPGVSTLSLTNARPMETPSRERMSRMWSRLGWKNVWRRCSIFKIHPGTRQPLSECSNFQLQHLEFCQSSPRSFPPSFNDSLIFSSRSNVLPSICH